MFDLALWQKRFQDYLGVRHFSPRTTENYLLELKPFFGFLKDQGLEGLPDVSRDTVEAYRTFLFYAEYHGHRLSAHTQSHRLSAVKAFLKFLAQARYILMDPAAGVELPKTPGVLPQQLLSEEEVERLLVAPDISGPLGLRDRALLELLYATAIRNSELGSLVLESVNLARNELHIHRGKGGKSRNVPMGEEAAHWLGLWLQDGRPQLVKSPGEKAVFLSCRGEPLGRSVLSEIVVRAAFEAGFQQRITPHHLRHCCATHMMRQGAGLRHLQVLLGHSSPAITQRYTRVEISDLHEVHRRCHPRERGR